MKKPRVSKTALNRTVGKSLRPVFLFDNERRIIFANSIAEEMIGYSAEELSSCVADYESALDTSLTELQRNVNGLCPPAQCFRGAAKSSFVRFRDLSTGQGTAEKQSSLSTNGAKEIPMLCRHAQFVGMPTESDTCEVLVFVGEPVQQSDQRERLGRDLTTEGLNHALHACLLQWEGNWKHDTGFHRFQGSSLESCVLRNQIANAIESTGNVTAVGNPGSGRIEMMQNLFSSRCKTKLRSPVMIQIDALLAQPESIQQTIREHWAEYDAKDSAILLSNAHTLDAASQLELFGMLELCNFQASVFATSETSLLELAARNEFHEQLAALLSSTEFVITPLASRVVDIPILAQWYLESSNRNASIQLAGFDDSAMDTLCQYPWYGETSEMAEVISQGAENARENKPSRTLVTLDDLPKKLSLALSAEEFPVEVETPMDLEAHLRDLELQLIQQSVDRHKGNKTKAAKMLGITRTKLVRRLESIGPDFREVDTEESP